VFVLDANKQPLDPVPPGRARILLTQGKAAVFRRYPFTLILKAAVSSPLVQELRVKIDPGSKTTGLAIVNDVSGKVVWAAEITHRGDAIKQALLQRRAVRRNRRQRKTRYRKPRFANRKRRNGWLAPSLESRVANITTWVRRLKQLAPVTALSLELVKFDMQRMQNAEIEGIAYQQGELAGYEVREYLLEKWGRRCAYCEATDVPLEIEHILCRKRGGTNRVSNLTIACQPCNNRKGTQLIQDFLLDQPQRLKRILAQAKSKLVDAAAVNATRWALYERLKECGLSVECGSGGLTKFTRLTQNLPKEHWIDAACVGTSTPPQLRLSQVVPLLITATGHGSRQKCNVNECGIVCSKPKGPKKVKGFQTGDMVRAEVSGGKNQGLYVGRVLVRASGSFDILTKQARVQGISYRFCTMLHRCDGYSYGEGAGHSSPVSATRGLLAR
jgi:5-methylcytosine-specific restriction endonuclease McrA